MAKDRVVSQLDDLVGLTTARKVLKAISADRLPVHSVLFYGGDGCGKDQLASILAKVWTCNENSTGEHQSTCSADKMCNACHASEKHRNPDVLVISPQGAGNLIAIKQLLPRAPESGEQVLSMEEFLRTPPLMSAHKVVILSNVERMTSATSNTLLKSLEEPPRFAKFVLTTQSTGSISATVLSRVLAIACSKPSHEELRIRFPEAIEEDLLISEGSPGRLIKILETPGPYRNAVAFARELPHRRQIEALAVAERFRKLAEQFESQLGWSLRATYAELMVILSLVFAREARQSSTWVASFVEAHERLLANGSSALITDALFTHILEENP
jgi:hypothetical protein